MVKSSPARYIDILRDGHQFFIAEIYTITLRNGHIYTYTSLDVDVRWKNTIFKSKALLPKRGGITQVKGMEVQEITIEAYPTTAELDGVPFLEALRKGALDGGTIRVERLLYESRDDFLIKNAEWFQLGQGVKPESGVVQLVGQVAYDG